MTQYSKRNLLESLSVSIGCICLSDLRQPHLQSAICEQLVSIKPEAYSLNVWTDAIHYLLNISRTFSSPQEAHTFLCQQLSELYHLS